MSEPNFFIDPDFDSTYIGVECDVCGREFDQSIYESDTCSKCEDKLTEKIAKLRKKESKVAKTKKMTHDEYVNVREFYRSKGARAIKENNINDADYCAGVVRGLDLAFRDGSAKRL
jgi:hypothetical protein